MRTRTKLAITLSAPLVGLLLAEILVRALALEPLPPPRAEGNLNIESPDPKIMFENRPGGELHIYYTFALDAAPVVVTARANEQGFRGPLAVNPKPTGVFRIACLGDSHTWGYGVSEGETWVDVCGKSLTDEFGASRVEAMNCGVSAHDTEQEVGFLFARILAYQPDLVLVQFFVNDAALRAAHQPEGSGTDWLTLLTHPRRPGVMRWLRSNLRCIDVLANGIYSRRHLSDFARTRSALFTEEGEGWQRVRASLLRARDRLRAEKVGFAVVLFPFLIRKDGQLLSHAAFQTVSDFCRANEIECWDLESDYDGLDVDALRVHPLDFHANAAGHRIFGEGVARRLTDSPLLDALRTTK